MSYDFQVCVSEMATLFILNISYVSSTGEVLSLSPWKLETIFWNASSPKVR